MTTVTTEIINKPELSNPIEYYEALAGYGKWAAIKGHGQFYIRVENESRWQRREHEEAMDDLRAKRNQ